VRVVREKQAVAILRVAQFALGLCPLVLAQVCLLYNLTLPTKA
jgi:hypothetical protein